MAEALDPLTEALLVQCVVRCDQACNKLQLVLRSRLHLSNDISNTKFVPVTTKQMLELLVLCTWHISILL